MTSHNHFYLIILKNFPRFFLKCKFLSGEKKNHAWSIGKTKNSKTEILKTLARQNAVTALLRAANFFFCSILPCEQKTICWLSAQTKNPQKENLKTFARQSAVTAFLRATNVFFVQFYLGKTKNSKTENLKTFARQSAVTAFLRATNFFLFNFTRRTKNHTLAQRPNKKSPNGKFKHFCATIRRYGIFSRNQRFFCSIYQENKKSYVGSNPKQKISKRKI